ncbi:4Fe-4S single cluster domain-containing protein [Palleronia caenipelagi]|uniref:Radical SAM protein n=1 Tax=Palleronia caenipelagi TaxID=2489174 RepID=A0A547PMV6_9RHOB|nr:4Fe-4S single cluster domain-containing protein [Palleronia caenipelagi]TRD15476.1 radical SAM protein [Palleronia caenipelagi]
MKLRLYEYAEGISRLGPGRRVGIWFQGCPFSCVGCVAPDTLPAGGGVETTVEDLLDWIRTAGKHDGITISGGEPFAQSKALAEILGGARELRLGTIVFSGYTLNSLRRRAKREPSISSALSRIDLLVDGQFEIKKRSLFGLRGSDNQKFHFLTQRYRGHVQEIFGYERSKFELVEGMTGKMLVGVPDQAAELVWDRLAPDTEDPI